MGGLIVMTEISLTEFIGFRESQDGGQQTGFAGHLMDSFAQGNA